MAQGSVDILERQRSTLMDRLLFFSGPSPSPGHRLTRLQSM